MRNWGVAFALLGALAAIAALAFMRSSVSTEEMTTLPYTGTTIGSGRFVETYNLARAQLREMVFQGGGILFLAGIVLLVGASIGERLRSLGLAERNPSASPAAKEAVSAISTGGAGAIPEVSKSATMSAGATALADIVAPDNSQAAAHHALDGGGATEGAIRQKKIALGVIAIIGGSLILVTIIGMAQANRPDASPKIPVVSQDRDQSASNVLNNSINAAENAAQVGPLRETNSRRNYGAKSDLDHALAIGQEFGREYQETVERALSDAEAGGYPRRVQAVDSAAKVRRDREELEKGLIATGIDPDGDQKIKPTAQ